MEREIYRLVFGVTSCFIVRHEGAILIDAGNSNQEGKFLRVVDSLGIRPEEIRLIVATHGHADHIGSAATIHDITGAPIAIHQADKEWLEKGIIAMPPGVTAWGRVLASLTGLAEGFFRFRPAEVDITIADDGLSLVDFGIPGHVVHTPGHTSGSVSVLLETNDLFAGDQAMNGLPFRFGSGLPSLAEDLDEVKASWLKILTHDLSTIYPGHGKPFPAEVMRRAVL